MKPTLLFGMLCLAFGQVATAAEADCLKLAQAVKQAVSSEQSKVLEIVATEVAAAPDCACEVVKAAIVGAQAEPATVAAIVEAAATAAPQHLRLISQCAVAVAPDALAQVQKVLAKLDPNRGEAASSAKSAKDAKQPVGEVATLPNPLDFPGQGPLGPIFGGPGGEPLIPLFPPIIINPPDVTSDNGTPDQ